MTVEKEATSSPALYSEEQSKVGSLPSTVGHNQVQDKDLNVEENSFAGLVLQFM